MTQKPMCSIDFCVEPIAGFCAARILYRFQSSSTSRSLEDMLDHMFMEAGSSSIQLNDVEEGVAYNNLFIPLLSEYGQRGNIGRYGFVLTPEFYNGNSGNMVRTCIIWEDKSEDEIDDHRRENYYDPYPYEDEEEDY